MIDKKIKGLPEIYEAYFDENVFYPVVVTELIKGENLCNRLDVDAREYGKKLLDIVDACHSRNLILRDINAQNLMIGDESDELYYVDTSSVLVPSQDHTMTAVGQENYFAPEEMNNINYKFKTEQEEKEFREHLPYLTDLYKVGLVLKEMYHGKSLKNIKGHPVGRDLELEKIIGKLTECNPQDRYQNVDEVLKDLVVNESLKDLVVNESVVKDYSELTDVLKKKFKFETLENFFVSVFGLSTFGFSYDLLSHVISDSDLNAYLKLNRDLIHAGGIVGAGIMSIVAISSYYITKTLINSYMQKKTNLSK